MANGKIRAAESDLVELRQEYDDFVSEWQDIRDEGQTDMRFVAGDPWDEKDKQARRDAGRPIIAPDEIGQYVNRIINDIRQNKRAIQVAPRASGATPKTAEFRQNLFRQIEHDSNAEGSAYPVTFENAVQRSYGYFRVVPRYVSHRDDNQELRIEAIPNPDLVTPDPYAIQPDGRDWKRLYLAERWKVRDFQAQFPKATIRDFGVDAQRLAPAWVKSEGILVGERWLIKTRPRALHLVQPASPHDQPPMPPVKLFEDEILSKAGKGAKVIRQLREVDYPYVVKQITNGLEILEETTYQATTIPFVSCYGKILYLDEGAGPRRKILSLVRLARHPVQLYAYIRCAQMEVVGMTPKVPYFYYKGSLSPAAINDIAKSLHEPVAAIEVDPYPQDYPPSNPPLAMPVRNPYQPVLDQLEIMAEAARRAIQAAMGQAILPTAAQRSNEKSGKAIDKINDSIDQGSFHFVDHFNGAIQRGGEILEDWAPHYYDTLRHVTVRTPKDQSEQVTINDPNNPDSLDATQGDHAISISVGPAFDSEREQASDFATTLVQELPQIAPLAGPQKTLKILASAIRLKNVGPLGDEIADLLDPPQQAGAGPAPDPIALQQQVQQLTQQLQQELQDKGGRIKVAQIAAQSRLDVATQDRAAKIEIARITAARQAADTAAEAQEERIAIGVNLLHEEREAAKDRAHDVGLAAQAHAHTTAQADQAHRQATEAAVQQHAQALEQGAASTAAQSQLQAEGAAQQAAARLPDQQGGGPQ